MESMLYQFIIPFINIITIIISEPIFALLGIMVLSLLIISVVFKVKQRLTV